MFEYCSSLSSFYCSLENKLINNKIINYFFISTRALLLNNKNLWQINDFFFWVWWLTNNFFCLQEFCYGYYSVTWWLSKYFVVIPEYFLAVFGNAIFKKENVPLFCILRSPVPDEIFQNFHTCSNSCQHWNFQQFQKVEVVLKTLVEERWCRFGLLKWSLKALLSHKPEEIFFLAKPEPNSWTKHLKFNFPNSHCSNYYNFNAIYEFFLKLEINFFISIG